MPAMLEFIPRFGVPQIFFRRLDAPDEPESWTAIVTTKGIEEDERFKHSASPSRMRTVYKKHALPVCHMYFRGLHDVADVQLGEQIVLQKIMPPDIDGVAAVKEIKALYAGKDEETSYDGPWTWRYDFLLLEPDWRLIEQIDTKPCEGTTVHDIDQKDLAEMEDKPCDPDEDFAEIDLSGMPDFKSMTGFTEEDKAAAEAGISPRDSVELLNIVEVNTKDEPGYVRSEYKPEESK